MTTHDFVSELVLDWQWRSDEIRLLRNAASAPPDEDVRAVLRRSLIVVLYSHFEGFSVFALSHYLTAVNRQKMRCREAVAQIVAASWEGLFHAMESGDEKCKVFQKALPQDAKLHRHWRRRHFVEEIDRFLDTTVTMPDDVIDAESNLKPLTLKRNLFLLGLDHHFVDEHADLMNRLLKRRNDIAHGDERRGISADEYEKYELMVLRIKDKLIELLTDAHRNARYSRHPQYAI